MRTQKIGKKTYVIMGEDEYRDLHQDHGVCLVCGEVAGETNPEAIGEECPACRTKDLFGLPILMAMGLIKLVVGGPANAR